MPDFLLEIGCEEIPARMIDTARIELGERVLKLLNREGLSPTGTMTYFDSPRRLAIYAPGIPGRQADLEETVTGPATKIAFRDGQPTQAALAFAKKVGREVSELRRTTTPKGSTWCRRC